jgi:hypothetical protein
VYDTDGFVHRREGKRPPTFPVSVAFKWFRDFVSCLEPALPEGSASVAVKRENRTESEGFCDGGGKSG